MIPLFCFYLEKVEHQATNNDKKNNKTPTKSYTNTPICLPPHANKQPTSPDITTITNTLQKNTEWTTMQALSSDHLSILTTYKTKTNYKIQRHCRTKTNIFHISVFTGIILSTNLKFILRKIFVSIAHVFKLIVTYQRPSSGKSP